MDYITPLMYEAVGDGISDDTQAFKDSIIASQSDGKPLLIPSGYTFRVTGPLNSVGDEIVLNIIGCNFAGMFRYDQDIRGCIKLDPGTKMFYKATVSGCIHNTYVIGVRQESVCVFDHCHLKSLNISNCHFADIDAFLYNSSLWNICRIIGNTFLTCYWFAKFVSEEESDLVDQYFFKQTVMVDSTIIANYINGGTENSDNNCFEFAYYNGASIQNNFIDYYRTIYHPKSSIISGFDGPVSIGNHYQMFKYLYYFEEDNFANSTCTFTSIGDAFNHTDPDSLQPQNSDAADILRGYMPLSYLRQGITNGEGRELPSCIGYSKETGIINITDAKIESNIGCILFVMDSITTYAYAKFKLTIACDDVLNTNYIQADAVYQVYNGGNYRFINRIETNLIKPVTTLPTITDGWVVGLSAFGMNVLYNNRILTATCRYSQSQWHYAWLDEYGN